MRNTALFASMLGCLILAPPGYAQDPQGPNHPEIPNIPPMDLVMTFSLQDLRTMGLSVFSTPFNKQDGLGDGPSDGSASDPTAFGDRPTLQGNGTFLRVNGLDAQSCNECHGFVRHSTKPPVLGIGGVGGAATNAVIMPSLIDVADSSEKWVKKRGPKRQPDLPLVSDGVADYNGRFANPPFLFGGGGVELLGKEMTADLQDLLALARAAPEGATVSLDTHGVNFGNLTALGNGEVDLADVEGIGPEDIEGVLPEEVLVVRPFGRKGENFSMRDFDRGATQFHFGIQPVEVVGEGVDADGDLVSDEVTVAEMTALHIFDVTNPRPEEKDRDPRAQAGFETFVDIGCADCHKPTMETTNVSVPLAHPEEPADPWENVYYEVNLVTVGFAPNDQEGVSVPLFSDLKRHDMGPRLAETFERGELSNRQFITARLWGIGDTEPYLHDARATTLYEAIEFHGEDDPDTQDMSEAQGARDLFINVLSPQEQSDLIYFLRRLRTPENPNGDIAAMLAIQ